MGTTCSMVVSATTCTVTSMGWIHSFRKKTVEDSTSHPASCESVYTLKAEELMPAAILFGGSVYVHWKSCSVVYHPLLVFSTCCTSQGVLILTVVNSFDRRKLYVQVVFFGTRRCGVSVVMYVPLFFC